MVTSVPEDLEDAEPIFSQRQCNLQVWAFVASGDGGPSVIVEISFGVVFVVPEFCDEAGWGTCDECGWWPNGDVD